MSRELTKNDFRKEVIESKVLSMVKFKTDWSGACQIIEPVFNDLAKSYRGTVNFYTIDIEEEPGIDSEYGVMELPTILFFRSGQVIDHAVGLISKNRLVSKIENALAYSGN